MTARGVRREIPFTVIAGEHNGASGVCVFVYRRDTPHTISLFFPGFHVTVLRAFFADGVTCGADCFELSIAPQGKQGDVVTFNWPYRVLLFNHDDLIDALEATWRVVEMGCEDKEFDMDAALVSLLKAGA